MIADHIYWALALWTTLCRALYSCHACNSSLLLSCCTKGDTEALSNFPKANEWDCWDSVQAPHALTHDGSSPLCSCCLCSQDMQPRVDSEASDKAFSHLPLFPGQVQRKAEQRGLRSRQNLPCAPWPQGPECEADGTQTLIQDSHCPALPLWHFIWIYLFILLK